MPTAQRRHSILLDNAQTRIIMRYVQNNGISEHEALVAWKELIRFLKLCGSTQETLAPSRVVDEIWHEAILHTREYEVLCNEFAARFVHHVPSYKTDGSAYERTLGLLVQTYGEVDHTIWPLPNSPSNECEANDSPCSRCGSKCED